MMLLLQLGQHIYTELCTRKEVSAVKTGRNFYATNTVQRPYQWPGDRKKSPKDMDTMQTRIVHECAGRG